MTGPSQAVRIEGLRKSFGANQVLGALAALFWAAPGSKQVRHTFFSPHDMWQALTGNPRQGYYSVGEALWLNIRMFLAAEVLILALALLVAVIRQSAGPVTGRPRRAAAFCPWRSGDR